MKQREVILAAWQRRSKTHAQSPQFHKAAQFFEMIQNRPDVCWDDLVAEFRRNYYDAFDDIVPVLLDTDDPLIIHNFVRFADFTNQKEAEAASKLIQRVDPDKHEVTMLALAAEKDLQPAFKRIGQLPASVQAMLDLPTRPATSEGEAEQKKPRPKSQQK